MFKGWIGWSKWYKKNWGVYPPRDLICHIARLSHAERTEVLGLYKHDRAGKTKKARVGGLLYIEHLDGLLASEC